VTACRLATSPTRTSPFLAKATIEGVVLIPSAFAITTGSPPSRIETQLFVVPKSIPTVLDIIYILLLVVIYVTMKQIIIFQLCPDFKKYHIKKSFSFKEITYIRNYEGNWRERRARTH
jgi:hypothetical protein